MSRLCLKGNSTVNSNFSLLGQEGSVTSCARYPLASIRARRFPVGLNKAPKTSAGRAVILAANTKHGRFKNRREKRAKERFYRGEIKRVMREA